jgi:diacylglycerol kinase (ATP)
VKECFFTVVNPAAGGGRCGKLAGAALQQLRAAGLALEIVESRAPGDATHLARKAYGDGYRKFLAAGGDGTSYEIVNGLFPEAAMGEPPALGFLPLGTGNSFLREFTEHGTVHACAALIAGRRRPCDVLRLTHEEGALHYINLLSMGFAADVAFLRQRTFKGLGELGYLLAVLLCLARLRRRAFPLRVDGEAEPDRRRCLFLSFNNTKFTGGKMMIAPGADPSDGLVEYVRWGPIGRLGLLRNLPTLYDGSHIGHRMASRRGAKQIEFELEGPVDVMIDGEVLTLHCRRLDVLPAALDVFV